MSEGNPRQEYGWNDYLWDNADSIVTRARFQGSYRDDPKRLRTLEFAEDTIAARTIEEWQYFVEAYPDIKLDAEKLTKYENEDIPVRGYYLGKAVKRLLELAEAPATMIADFELLMSSFAPKGAQKYADAQRALIDNPGMSILKISELSGLDRSTIHVLLKKGALLRPEQ